MKYWVVVVAAAVCGLLNAGERKPHGMIKDYGAEKAKADWRAYFMGYAYAHGIGCERNLEKAFGYFLDGAKNGNRRAEEYVSARYWNGEGVDQNYKAAACWTERAARHGHAHSMFSMGIMRHFGLDGNTNCYEACQWFRSAVRNGDGNPEFEPDMVEEEGCGPEVSVRWVIGAAEYGDNDALYWLAMCYRRGQRLPRNKEMYEKLMVLAADGGHSLAKCVVGCEKWYGRISGSRAEGLELVREAEKQGSITAYKHLENLDKTGTL